MADKPMSILDHLEALRRVLIISLISIIPGSIAGWFIREDIMRILIKPVSDLHYKLVYIGATEALTAEIKIAFFAGLVLALPVIAYQIWKFVLPALHATEKRYIRIFVPLSVILFIGGIVFGYYTVFIYGVQFLLSFGGEGLTPMLSLGKYLSFALWFLIPFGIMFELPLVILLLVRIGLMSPKYLASKRKWVLLAAFVIAAVATPTTDMFSQSVMALAIYLLYEISIWVSYLVRPKKVKLPEGNQNAVELIESSNRNAAGKSSEIAVEDDRGSTVVDAGESVAVTLNVNPEAEAQAETHTEAQTEAQTETHTEAQTEAQTEAKDKSLEDIYRNIVERGNKNDE